MDLKVDATLDQTNADLKKIHDEFDNASKNAKDDRNIWGQRDLAKAMDDFANNWKIHRDKINEKLKSLSDKVDKAVAAWDDAENQLSNALKVDSE